MGLSDATEMVRRAAEPSHALFLWLCDVLSLFG